MIVDDCHYAIELGVRRLDDRSRCDAIREWIGVAVGLVTFLAALVVSVVLSL